MRRSVLYRHASAMLMLWGCVTGAATSRHGSIRPRATSIWLVLGRRRPDRARSSIGVVSYLRSGVNTFDARAAAAFIVFVAFGIVWSAWLGGFAPRQMAAFWPSYFMLPYIIAGLWLGRALVLIGVSVIALTALGYAYAGACSCRGWRWSMVAGCCSAAHGCSGTDMADLNDIIHQPLRLKIMAALNALPPGQGLDFPRLKKMTGATDGNLGAHIETLANAGYVSVTKAFVGKRPQTTVTPTAEGLKAFAHHVATLRAILPRRRQALRRNSPLGFPGAAASRVARRRGVAKPGAQSSRAAGPASRKRQNGLD